ncbi:tRNA 2-selenouridine(34) synthase MnmH [Erwinia sp. CPCC 100877]|nr:tRNA 2-selenouridine(34) synthase MnmH [Erwinia sp. CPCC 100877]
MDNASPVRSDSQDYRDIILSGVPLLDVRSPAEFAQGSLPGAHNLPLMNDDERARVGTCYKTEGQKAALALGHSLVCGEVREARMNAWRDWCQRHPNGYLYCSRGGLRSHLVQQWLQEISVQFPLIEGGYKAVRRYMMSALGRLSQRPMLLIAGNTGCGKTLMVRDFVCGVDLEGLARHRGSSFGRTTESQPSQANFENRLAATMVKKSQARKGHGNFFWVVEDEGAAIGSRHIPKTFRAQMELAEIVVIDDPFALRLERLKEEYFVSMAAAFIAQQGEESGWLAFAEYLRHGMLAIRRRLGEERFIRLNTLLEQSLKEHQLRDNAAAHLDWLTPLLRDYYDPMYRYQLAKKAQRIVFEGDSQQVREWLTQRGAR